MAATSGLLGWLATGLSAGVVAGLAVCVASGVVGGAAAAGIGTALSRIMWPTSSPCMTVTAPAR